MSSIGDALFTKTQQRVLGLLYGRPDKTFYLNELVRLAGMGKGAVNRELEKFRCAGLVTVTRIGNQSHFQANPDCPIYAELLGIVRKTFGIADEIKRALVALDAKIDLAFIYGSIAKSLDTAASDIDLMIVGTDLVYSDVVEALLPVEELLKRTINPSLYEKAEFIAKLKRGNSFLTRVMEQPKILIKDGEYGVEKFGQLGKDQST